MNGSVFSFTGIYNEEDFWRELPGSRLSFYDLSQLPGTNGYLSDDAASDDAASDDAALVEDSAEDALADETLADEVLAELEAEPDEHATAATKASAQSDATTSDLNTWAFFMLVLLPSNC